MSRPFSAAAVRAEGGLTLKLNQYNRFIWLFSMGVLMNITYVESACSYGRIKPLEKEIRSFTLLQVKLGP